ncbi:MAG: BREX system P-loop protein BrxC [Chloroflexi bacterium]|nr:BREX system P-loop protein BrxC [Chloroflexota bacterium]
MLIRETFATTIQERIEPVVKVADRKPAVLLGELRNLVVTPQWEQHLHAMLQAYTYAPDNEDAQDIGLWISGFFGSGKSLLMKTFGALLEGSELLGERVHDVFLSRLPVGSPDRSTLQRFLASCERTVTTTAVGGNLHAMQAAQGDTLALIAFKLFAAQRGYTHHWPLSWSVEDQLDARGLTDAFRTRAGELAGLDWEEVAADPEFHIEHLFAAAADTLPEHFRQGTASVEQSVAAALATGITPAMLVERLRRWCVARDAGGRRHKLLLQLDEVGQWISASPFERTMQVQALVETAATNGQGRLWLAVTAHGDVQALKQNVQQEQYAKINQRFATQCRLSNDDISLVVEERLLRKRQPARVTLERRFGERAGDLTDLGTLQQPRRVYPAPDAGRFALFYPYLPWTVAVIPDAVKGIAQAAGRDEALTGSNRTMIGVVQGAIIETPGLLDQPVGRVLALADLYDQLASDVPIETKTDLNRVRDSVPGATDFTTRVARALFLLGQAAYIPTTIENVARAVADDLDVSLPALTRQVRDELQRLVAAGYAKQVGEQYIFLSAQQRTFQDRVRSRQQELEAQTWDLSEGLKAYESEDALRFDRAPLQGREIALKLELDGRVVRNPTAAVTLRVFSPLQRALDQQLADDAAMRQRANAEQDNLLFRLGETPGLRAALALALATEQIADSVIGAAGASGADVDVARQAKQVDLPSHKAAVRRLLGQAVREGTIFFRGTAYQLAAAESPSASVRATLSQILPALYARFGDVPYRIGNEEAAVKAALSGNTTNADLQALGVYRADGGLNDSHPLISVLRGDLPQEDQAGGFIPAETLRQKLERPPYGWDGNAVKVGLALLLRASACRLLENSRVITDPSDPDTAALLAREARFKGLRVQGVKTDVDMAQLQQIRGYMQALWGDKPALVAATLSNVLGDRLKGMAQQAQTIRAWATTAQCPLPLAFEAGASLVGELLEIASPPARLRRFLDQADALLQFNDALTTVSDFQREHGARYGEVRDFFNRMVNAEVDLPELRRFIADWRTLTHERTLTAPARWNEVVQAQAAAAAAVDEQIARWQAEAQARLVALDDRLEERAQAAGVPPTRLEDEVAKLGQLYGKAREQAARSRQTLGEARGVLTALTAAELDVNRALRELEAQYRVDEPDQATARVHRAELGEPGAIRSADELDSWLDGVRRRLLVELQAGRVVVIE